MISVGERLRTARESKGLSISEVAVQTRISSRFIGAIEADDLSSLPGGFFYKSFVQQYAAALGVDLSEFQQQLEQVFRPEDSRVVPVPQSSASAPSLGSIAASSRWELYRGRTLVRVGLLVLMIAACTGLYVLWNSTARSAAAERSARPTAPVTSTTVPETQAPAPETAKQAPPAQETAPKPAQVETPTSPAPEPVAATAQAGGAGTLTVTSKERAWIEVRSDNKKLFVGIIEPDQPKSWQIASGGRLLTGNAGALDLNWEGKAVGALGGRGQVRTVVFSPGKAEIQVPPKKAETSDAAPKT